MKKFSVFLALLLLIPSLGFAATCPNLTRNLSRGMSGDDVKQLQQFLISQGALDAGFDSGFFGVKTEAAVQKFQCDQKLTCAGSASESGWGSVGPRTRILINQMCRAGQAVVTTVLSAAFASGNPDQSCQFGGKTILNRGSVTAYRSLTVPFSVLCESERRTCINGTLSGSFQNAFCIQNLAQSCSLDGETVYDGQFRAFYSSRSVQAPDACNQHVQLRECVNGRLTGTNDFQNASCTNSSLSVGQAVLAPTGLAAKCNAAGTQVTLSWNATPGASSYGVRVVPSGASTFTVSSDWYRSTTFSLRVSPNTSYSWWIHSNLDDSHLGLYTVGGTFSCVGGDVVSPNPSQSISVDGFDIYSPAPVLFGTQPRLYYGGWMNATQRHDNIYVADCPFAAGVCSNVRTVIDSASQGFEHVNDPTIVLHPAVGTSSAYYIMYMTGVAAGDNGMDLISNKIYYATSWANDGLNWSRPTLLMTGFWLPSATFKNGHIELYANSTTDGRVAKFDLGESGIEAATSTYLTYDNVTSIPPRYSNVDIVWRPTLNSYQMLAERGLGTVPGSSSVIDYLTSVDGVRWHLVNPSIISAAAGQFRVGTPAQWIDSAQWVYFGSTAQTDSMGFKIRFAQWAPAN